MCRWCKTLDDAKQIATEWRKNWGTAHWSSELSNLPLSITIGQNDICFSRSVRNLGVIFDDKLSMKQQYVSPPTWNCVELGQLDMSSQLMLPKPLWHPWFCHALITVISCCQGFLNSWLTNFKRFKFFLLDSFSKSPNVHTFHHFWLNCTGFQ